MCSLLLSNFFISCSNEELTSIDEEKVQFVLQSKSTEITKAAYQLLSPEEQYFIWDERTDYILAHEDLTAQQVDFLNELKSDLNIASFEDNSTENLYFKDKYDNESLGIFEPIQAYYYFGTLTNMAIKGTWSSISAGGSSAIWDFFVSDIGIIDDGGGSSGVDCNCHVGSVFSEHCKSWNCSTSQGCGGLWMFSCNGIQQTVI